MKPYRPYLGFIIDAVLGTVINVYLWSLIARFLPNHSDIPVWVFIAIPTGFILGALSGVSVTTPDRFTTGIFCVTLSVIFGGLYLFWFYSDVTSRNFKVALVENGHSLIWCIILFFRGTWLLAKSKEDDHHESTLNV